MRTRAAASLVVLLLGAALAGVNSSDFSDEDEVPAAASGDVETATTIEVCSAVCVCLCPARALGASVGEQKARARVSYDAGVGSDGQGEFPNEQLVRAQTDKVFRVILDGGLQQTIVKSDGTFALYDVAEGVHILEVDAPGWYFEQVKLDVHYRGNKLKVRATLNGESGGKVLPFPLQLHPNLKVKYFEEREKFDPTAYLKNPMVMMGLMGKPSCVLLDRVPASRHPSRACSAF